MMASPAITIVILSLYLCSFFNDEEKLSVFLHMKILHLFTSYLNQVGSRRLCKLPLYLTNKCRSKKKLKCWLAT